MAKTGLAAVMTGVGKRFEIREYPVADPWPGAIRIKVEVANVCGSDIHTWKGDRDPALKTTLFPTIMGHEMMGRIDALGEGVSTDSNGEPLAVGDRVVYGYTFPCHSCAYCRTGRTTWCTNKSPGKKYDSDTAPHFNGAFAQYYYLYPNHFVYKCPDAIPDPTAATLNCAMSQVIYALELGQLGLGETVVVQGAGGLGLFATAVARERGASKIIVIDGVPERLELAESFGAHELIDMRELPEPEQRIARVWELTKGIGAEIACDFVGFPSVMLEGLQMLGNGGRYLEVGNINTGLTCEFEPNLLVRRHLSITGMLQYEPRHLKQAVDFVEATMSRYPYQKLMAYEFPLTDINRAFDEQTTGRIPRAALRTW
ncbi:MAG: zinc-binding dehydrogenase [Chloroflexi bacterium]|nr:zinc-binding dehydrogenase [Chloroflexota bacterium]